MTIIGLNVKCPRCLQKQNVYEDIQKVANGFIFTMCKRCNEFFGSAFDEGWAFKYNNGTMPPHLPPKPYDWKGWQEADKMPRKQEAMLFDQDDDLINSNFGWED